MLCAAAPAQGEPASSCAWERDLAGGLGMLWFARSNGQGWGTAGTVALRFAATPCAHLPLRLEARAGTTSRGPPFGAGGNAVEVSQWSTDFGIDAAATHVLARGPSRTVGVEALVGPTVRVTRVGIRVYDQTEHATGVRVFAGVAAGGYLSVNGWRFALRTSTLLPWQRELGLSVAVGHRL